MSRPQKYRNVPVEIGPYRFASRAEGRRFLDLVTLQKAGEISDLALQPRFPLVVSGVTVGHYVGDFLYREKGKEKAIVEDVKGIETSTFKLKWKIVKAQYPEVEWRIWK